MFFSDCISESYDSGFHVRYVRWVSHPVALNIELRDVLSLFSGWCIPKSRDPSHVLFKAGEGYW